MRLGIPSGVGSALAWFAFPLAPALVGATYHQELNWSFGGRGGPDPCDWGWSTWIILSGPLLGYGFLAGATIDLPDDPGARGWRGWPARRSLWVAFGPWIGFLAWNAAIVAAQFVAWAYPPSRAWSTPPLPEAWRGGWVGFLLIALLGIGPLAYGWLFVAWAAARRARRLGRVRRSLARGLAVAGGFVGSLFGTFWAITEAWRGYFFDPRIAPALVAASSLALLAGCAATETVGEVRRRELFQAMLTAWLLGLALAWRWWSRSSPQPSPPSDPQVVDPHPELDHAPGDGLAVGRVVEPAADARGVGQGEVADPADDRPGPDDGGQ